MVRYDEEGSKAAGKPKGSVMTASFELEDQKFVALNGGPLYKFTEAISFVVNCDTQDELDHYWNKLTEGGQEVQCGWLKDKFGISWQIVPSILGELLQKGGAKSQSVMHAMLQMKKMDIKKLKEAYEAT